MARIGEAVRRWRTAFAAGVIALSATSAVRARAGACTPVRITDGTASLPAPWRAALDAVARATAKEGMPWSCPGGSVDLVLDGSGAVLTVTDARGRSASRRVPSPEELAPTAEALLAAPTDAGPPPAAPTATPSAAPTPVTAPTPSATARVPDAPRPPAEPRFFAQALLGARASGPGATGWATGQLRGILPIGPWSIGFWVRYDLPFAGPSGAPAGFSMDAVSGGFAFGRRLLSGPFELRASLDPSLAVVMMESGSEDVPHPEGAKVAFRIGANLSGAFRIAGIFRGIVALDGEFAPAGIGGLRKIQTSLPPVPWYTGGLLLGVEATIR